MHSTYRFDWFDGKVVEKVPLGLGCVLDMRSEGNIKTSRGQTERSANLLPNMVGGSHFYVCHEIARSLHPSLLHMAYHHCQVEHR